MARKGERPFGSIFRPCRRRWGRFASAVKKPLFLPRNDRSGREDSHKKTGLLPPGVPPPARLRAAGAASSFHPERPERVRRAATTPTEGARMHTTRTNGRGRGLRARLLRMPVFYKVLLANAAGIVVFSVAAGAAAHALLRGATEADSVATFLVAGAICGLATL